MSRSERLLYVLIALTTHHAAPSTFDNFVFLINMNEHRRAGSAYSFGVVIAVLVTYCVHYSAGRRLADRLNYISNRTLY